MHTHDDPETLSRLMDGEWRGLDLQRCIDGVCKDATLRAKWARYHLARDALRDERFAAGALDADGALLARIGAALAEEPAYSNVTVLGGARAATAPPPEPRPSVAPAEVDTEAPAADGRRAALGGFAIAASVALVTVVGLELWSGGAPGADSTEGAVRVAERSAAATAPLAAAETDATSAVADDAFSTQIPGVPLPAVELVANTAGGAYWRVPGSSERREAEGRLNMLLSQHIENSPTAERQGMLPYSRLVGYDERAPER